MKSHVTLVHSHQDSAKKIAHILADTYLLYLKTQNFHWNVEDRRFAMLHAFFEEQYKELALASDDLAERIRMLGFHAPSTFSEFTKLSGLSEKKSPKNGDEMLRILLGDHEHIISELKNYIKALNKSDDEGTIDLFIERLRAHEKNAWMIRSHLSS